MVAPTRTPEARGVKCELCQEILKKTTWLDQKTPAKSVDIAKNVLDLFNRHLKSKCPCIPKNIENLLIGSTHFEIHRLVSIALDAQIHKKLGDWIHQQNDIQQAATNTTTSTTININDCQEASQNISKFKNYAQIYDQKNCDKTKRLLWHLKRATDYWSAAMSDQTSPFNSKLALRLGLTHHVIYTCYLFKYYKLLDYQLIATNLLLNSFRAIEGVTMNAVIHAYSLLIKTLIDCNQLKLAKHYLKQAVKLPNFQNKTYYESILLSCVECELCLLEGGNESYDMLDDLLELAIIQKDDKLQHYHARTLALSVVIRYIHCYKARSELCFEFYHLFRYVCAIIRRCYESSFDLVLQDFSSRPNSSSSTNNKKESRINANNNEQSNVDNQILIHSWIRFAACDFAFSAFDLLSDFYLRAGHPENLELLYNGLNLIAYRTSSCYWQARMASIGCALDIICDKFSQANLKLESMSKIIGYTNDDLLMVLLRLDLEVSTIALMSNQSIVIKSNVFNEIKQRLTFHQKTICSKVYKLELYDCKSGNFQKLKNTSCDDDQQIIQSATNQLIRRLILQACYLHIQTTLKHEKIDNLSCSGDKGVVWNNLKDQLNFISNILDNCQNVEYPDHHKLLEILLQFSGINHSDNILLESVKHSNIFNKVDDITNDELYDSLISQFEKLKTGYTLDILEALKNIDTLSPEDIVTFYLKNSEPNPDYQLYRKAHDLMFSIRLRDQTLNHSLLLYHFSESQTANTLRYRWMMIEEQQMCPYVYASTNDNNNSLATTTNKPTGPIKLLAFNEKSINPNKLIKWLARNVPEDFRLAQVKSIPDDELEHYLVVSFDVNRKLPIYFHATRSITSDDFIQDKRANEQGNLHQLTMANNVSRLIKSAKKTLFIGNSRLRNEKRQKLESELSLLLHDIETELLTSQMRETVFQPSHQVGLILDQTLEHIPIESLPSLRAINQPIFRVPSLRVFCLLIQRALDVNNHLTNNGREVHGEKLVYLLDPANNLSKTRERFDFKLKTQKLWTGCIGQAPKNDQLESWLSSCDIYLFIGHGAGMTYYNKLAKNRGLQAVSHVNTLAIVMGCSSGQVQAQGTRLESFGISWMFVMKGAPAYLGLLWDVTDTDIDRFLDAFLGHWLPDQLNWVPSMQTHRQLVDGKKKVMSSSEAMARSRQSCQLKYLVGSAPVVYGLPMTCLHTKH